MKELAAKPALDRHIGALLRGHRRAKEISQHDLAATVGLTFQQIQKYECGENRISASKLVEMARALDVPITAFFAGLETAYGDDLLSRFCSIRSAGSRQKRTLHRLREGDFPTKA